uniref:Uncharacterized protein n=1 Tax=Romanomermis culicivorax TaxID=13658 RepID=A0A915L0C7_ROMCU
MISSKAMLQYSVTVVILGAENAKFSKRSAPSPKQWRCSMNPSQMDIRFFVDGLNCLPSQL